MQDKSYCPETCVWELTLECNMRCMHCGSQAGKKRANELSVAECMFVADDLIRLKCKSITFIGGEVFLYPGWEKIARHLDDHGVLVNIITNGWLLGDEQMEQIQHARLTNVGISLDGMAEDHDRIRGRRDSFKRVLNAFERLEKEGIDVGVVTTLAEWNIADLQSMYNLLVRHGVASWQIQIATGMGHMCANRERILDPRKMAGITDFFRKKSYSADLVMLAGDDIGYFDENEKHLRHTPGHWGEWRGCQAGLSVIGIDSIGNVRGCESLYDARFIEGNVREKPLETIWHRETAFAYNRQFNVSLLQGKCAGCDKADQCRGGCRGINYFSTGSVFQSVYCSRQLPVDDPDAATL